MPDRRISAFGEQVDAATRGAQETVEVSVRAFSTVPQKRARYIALYAALVFLWFVPNVAMFLGYMPRPITGVAILVLILACQVIFYANLIGVLRIMGYATWLIVAICCIVFLPVPGVLVMAVIDRNIATAWDAADAQLRDRQPRRGS